MRVVVESWKPDSATGRAQVSCRLQARDYNPHLGVYEWTDSIHTYREWDWSVDAEANHERAVRYAMRSWFQKDPVVIEHGGDTVRGVLWIVEMTD